MLSWLLPPGCLYDTQIFCLLMPGLPKGVPIPFASLSHPFTPVYVPMTMGVGDSTDLGWLGKIRDITLSPEALEKKAVVLPLSHCEANPQQQHPVLK